MLGNYFKLSIRNLFKNKIFSVVNIGGLSLGIMSCLIIVSYVVNQLSYDLFHANHETIYRVVQNQEQEGKWYKVGRTPAKLAQTLKEQFTEIKNSTHFAMQGNVVLGADGKLFEESKSFYAESTLFEIFTFPFIEGQPLQSLHAPNSIVITESLAKKYFGTKSALGKIIVFNQQYPLTITGILKDLPKESHLQFDFVIPISFLKNYGVSLDEWGANAFYTYIQLHNTSQQPNVDAKLKDFAKKTFNNSSEQFYLQPLTEIHLYSHFDFHTDFGLRGDIRYVQFFSVLALIILLIGCFNFINLTTAQATKRVKEVFVRKTIGAKRRQLIIRFLTESVLLVGISMVLGILLVEVTLPFFNNLLNVNLSFQLSKPVTAIILAGIFFITVSLACIYPALFLSGLSRQTTTFKETKTFDIRKLLVVSQFTISCVMIIALIVIYQQLQYWSQAKLGIEKSQILYVELKGDLKKNYQVLKEKLLQNSLIRYVSGTGYYSMPYKIIGTFGAGGVKINGKKSGKDLQLSNFQTDYNFVETLGIQIKEGRTHNKNFGKDSVNLILNESAVKQLELKNPVGTAIDIYGQKGIVIGVAKDFHFADLKSRIEPVVFSINASDVSFLLVKTDIENLFKIKKLIEDEAIRLSGDYPIEVKFMNDDYNNLYKNEQTLASLFTAFGILALLIACLGLFGLATFSAEQRTKEIGIRKVLGASVSQIITLLSKDFLTLVLISFVIAIPLAWYAMHQWLQNFAYRIDISWWIFALAGVLALLIALLTVSFQAIRAALMNPVKSLRTE